MRKTAVLALTLLFCASASYAARVYTAAVADFEAQNLSAYDSLAVSEFFRSGMVNAGVVRIINRSSMETVLAEQKFQMSGCTDQDCVVQMGKLLNAEKVISGSIVSFNEEYYINAKVIDVETGEIQYSEQVKCKEKAEMPKKAEELALVVSEKISKKKPMLRDTSKERKKFAIYLCAITPTIYLSGNTQTLKGFINGTDSYVKTAKNDLVPAGHLGFKYFPWNNLYVDLRFRTDYSRDINTDRKIEMKLDSPGAAMDSSFYEQYRNYDIGVICRESYDISLNYIFDQGRKISYNISGGLIRGDISSEPFNIRYGEFRSVRGSVISEDYWAYFLGAGVNYRFSNNFGLSFAVLGPVQTSNAAMKLDFTYMTEKWDGTTIHSRDRLEIQPQIPIILKLSASYYFNFRFVAPWEFI